MNDGTGGTGGTGRTGGTGGKDTFGLSAGNKSKIFGYYASLTNPLHLQRLYFPPQT